MAAAGTLRSVSGLPPSAFPSVVVDVPAYVEQRQQFGPGGEFNGMALETVAAHQEVLRMPAS